MVKQYTYYGAQLPGLDLPPDNYLFGLDAARVRCQHTVCGLDEQARWKLLEHQVRVVFAESAGHRERLEEELRVTLGIALDRQTHYGQFLDMLALADLISPGMRAATLSSAARTLADCLAWIAARRPIGSLPDPARPGG